MAKPIIAPIRACLPFSVFSGLSPLVMRVKPAPKPMRKRMMPARTRALGRSEEMSVLMVGKVEATVSVSLSMKVFSRETWAFAVEAENR